MVQPFENFSRHGAGRKEIPGGPFRLRILMANVYSPNFGPHQPRYLLLKGKDAKKAIMTVYDCDMVRNRRVVVTGIY